MYETKNSSAIAELFLFLEYFVAEYVSAVCLCVSDYFETSVFATNTPGCSGSSNGEMLNPLAIQSLSYSKVQFLLSGVKDRMPTLLLWNLTRSFSSFIVCGLFSCRCFGGFEIVLPLLSI